jgi:hypothetical protein
MSNAEGETVAANIQVYAGEPEEYYSIITLEAYNSLKECMDFRASYGEKISGKNTYSHILDLIECRIVSLSFITGNIINLKIAYIKLTFVIRIGPQPMVSIR